MKKNICLAVCLCLTGIYQAIGQSYGTTLGLRLGNERVKRTVGISMQHRVMKHMTVEGILQTDFNRNSTVHALLEMHRGILTQRFNFYTGAGISFGSEESIRKNRHQGITMAVIIDHLPGIRGSTQYSYFLTVEF